MFTRAWLIDVSERAASTFVEAGAGVLVLAGTDVFHIAPWKAAAAAGVSAVLTYVKGLVATQVGEPGTAGLLRPPRPPRRVRRAPSASASHATKAAAAVKKTKAVPRR